MGSFGVYPPMFSEECASGFESESCTAADFKSLEVAENAGVRGELAFAKSSYQRINSGLSGYWPWESLDAA
jgi:hypothetical protein